MPTQLKLLIAVSFFLLLAACNSGKRVNQDFSGTWEGTLSQDAGGLAPAYDYIMEIVQLDNEISGTATIQIPAGGYAGQLQFSGTVSGNTLSFQDTKVITSTIPAENSFWCLKRGQLKLSGDTLSGLWSADNCSPGTITLSRQSGVRL
ncbi:MAG: hypothetical protein ABI700_05465 [Chloroflexota bacterium]